jgi:ferredoxin
MLPQTRPPNAPFDAKYFPLHLALLSVSENMFPIGNWTVISKDPFLVRFEPQGISSVVSPGSDLLEAARRAGIQLASNCNGQGDCGECCVIVLEGQVSSLTQEERECLSPAELEEGRRLACCTRVYSAARVRAVSRLRSPSDGGQRQHQDAEQQVEL